MDKNALIQYADMKEEIKDLRERIDKDEIRLRKIEEDGVVADTVKGTRRDGTIGSIRIEGFPHPEYWKVKAMLKRRVEKLSIMEDELLEAMNAVDDYINAIGKSELRIMFRLYYIDDLTWEMVAMRMNYRFPKRKISYTKDNCRIRHDRFLDKIK